MKQPAKFKDEKFASLIGKFAAEYFSIESSKGSLITVTRVDVMDRGRRALVYFTALPQENEPKALDFAKRRRRDFRKYIMDKKSFGFAPNIDFCIDEGEHNRQRVFELLNESPVENTEDKG